MERVEVRRIVRCAREGLKEGRARIREERGAHRTRRGKVWKREVFGTFFFGLSVCRSVGRLAVLARVARLVSVSFWSDRAGGIYNALHICLATMYIGSRA